MITKNVLKEVIEAQRKWILTIEKGVLRKKLDKIKLMNSFALIITGIRRCGKSTLLGQLLAKQKTFYYLNLEDPRLTGFELADFNKVDVIFKEAYGDNGVYFFDEIQNVNEWEIFVRFLTDKKSEVVLTGSNASLLGKELGTKLTGRHIQLELFPFSYLEFIDFFNLKLGKDSFEKYLFKGGFPEFLKENDETILNELLKDVLMRDIVTRFGIKNTSALKKLAMYLISNVGSEVSYNSLKKVFEVKSVQSIIDYVSYMEDAYMIFQMPKFSYSFKKQQVNPKKIYSIDNGFSRFNSVSFSKDVGKMLENSVFLALRQNHSDIFYFQEKKECDFVIKEKGKVTKAIQVCYELNDENMNRELNGLLEAMDEFKLKKGVILTFEQDDEFVKDGKRVVVKSVWKWLSES